MSFHMLHTQKNSSKSFWFINDHLIFITTLCNYVVQLHRFRYWYQRLGVCSVPCCCHFCGTHRTNTYRHFSSNQLATSILLHCWERRTGSSQTSASCGAYHWKINIHILPNWWRAFGNFQLWIQSKIFTAFVANFGNDWDYVMNMIWDISFYFYKHLFLNLS